MANRSRLAAFSLNTTDSVPKSQLQCELESFGFPLLLLVWPVDCFTERVQCAVIGKISFSGLLVSNPEYPKVPLFFHTYFLSKLMTLIIPHRLRFLVTQVTLNCSIPSAAMVISTELRKKSSIVGFLTLALVQLTQMFDIHTFHFSVIIFHGQPNRLELTLWNI